MSDTSTSNYELIRIKSISGTTVTPEEAVLNAHASGAIFSDQAEEVFFSFDLAAYRRIRAMVDNTIGAQAISIDWQLTTFDSY